MTPSAKTLVLTLAAVPMALALGASSSPEGQKPKAKSPAPDGKALFAGRCAPCHGKDGAGGAGYKAPLRGKRTVAELSAYLAKSMPPGQGTPAAQAKGIAAYMHGAFYSPLAEERNRPARVEMARLTAKEFRNAVADLMGGTAPTVPDVPPGGLKGEYYKGREVWKGEDRVLTRTDAGVAFDFGVQAPVKELPDAKTFSIVWTGSVLAPDTGEYEFIVRSDHAAKLFFNGAPQPLVDGWVRSASDKEFRGTVTLLGGRAYPLRLEFQKATQGVNDDDKVKAKPAPPAHVELLWRRPKRVAEPIPAHLLYPKDVDSVYVVGNAFPADDRSIGYERGVRVDKDWDEAVTQAALEASSEWARRVRDSKNLVGDCDWLLQRAFRRGLDDETKKLYIAKQLEGRSPEAGAKRVALLAMLSPRFLYREIGGKDAYATAASLSFGLWDTVPDLTLQKAVWEGKLKTPEDVRVQATRMANDPRAWAKLRDFLLLWTKVDEIPDIVKSAKKYPEFDAATAADLRTSYEMFLEANGWDFRRLMLSESSYLNGRLSKIYGGGLAPGASFQAVETPGRKGLLSQPYLLARLGYLEGSDPIHRGVLVVRNMLGRVLNPPPMAFTPLAASAHPTFTTRERVAFQTKPDACKGCHGLINPIGFTFEGYDALGRKRLKDGAKAVDSTGYYVPPSGAKVVFKDAGDLATYLADGDESHAAFVEKLFVNMVRQPARAYGLGTIQKLQRSFEKDGLDVRKLMVETMVVATGQK